MSSRDRDTKSLQDKLKVFFKKGASGKHGELRRAGRGSRARRRGGAATDACVVLQRRCRPDWSWWCQRSWRGSCARTRRRAACARYATWASACGPHGCSRYPPHARQTTSSMYRHLAILYIFLDLFPCCSSCTRFITSSAVSETSTIVNTTKVYPASWQKFNVP